MEIENEERVLIQRFERLDEVRDKLAIKWMYDLLHSERLVSKADELKARMLQLGQMKTLQCRWTHPAQLQATRL